MTRSTQLTVSSTLIAIAIVLLWFKAPIVPSVAGALAASLLLLRGNRQQQPQQRETKSSHQRPR